MNWCLSQRTCQIRSLCWDLDYWGHEGTPKLAQTYKDQNHVPDLPPPVFTNLDLLSCMLCRSTLENWTPWMTLYCAITIGGRSDTFSLQNPKMDQRPTGVWSRLGLTPVHWIFLYLTMISSLIQRTILHSIISWTSLFTNVSNPGPTQVINQNINL